MLNNYKYNVLIKITSHYLLTMRSVSGRCSHITFTLFPILYVIFSRGHANMSASPCIAFLSASICTWHEQILMYQTLLWTSIVKLKHIDNYTDHQGQISEHQSKWECNNPITNTRSLIVASRPSFHSSPSKHISTKKKKKSG